ncbi:hypothetical protein PG985_011160 [Apiospora marii]|uniref:uncharacterized protein n=1 Tax=Apiospora marii TaxID=335849 RepID=UPI00313151F1
MCIKNYVGYSCGHRDPIFGQEAEIDAGCHTLYQLAGTDTPAAIRARHAGGPRLFWKTMKKEAEAHSLIHIPRYFPSFLFQTNVTHPTIQLSTRDITYIPTIPPHHLTTPPLYTMAPANI